MKLEEVPPAYREAVAVHEAFRRLGFKSEDLYFRMANVNQVFIQWLGKNNENFSVVCGEVDGDKEHVFQLWTDLVKSIVSGDFPEESLQQIFNESHIFKNSVGFLTALHRKGIDVPNRQKKPPEQSWDAYLRNAQRN